MDAQKVGQRTAMQRPRPAKRNQGKVARIVPPLDRNHPDGAHHVVVGNRQNSPRRRLRPDGQRHSNPGQHCRPRGIGVQRHLPIKQPRRQMPQHDMRIGHRRRDAAVAIGRRPRPGTGALRSDGQGALGHLRYRSAPRANRDHVHHRQRQGPFAHMADLCQADLAILDQADIRTRPTDVDGDDIVYPAGLRHRARPHDARRWPRQRRQRRRPLDRRRTCHAAIRLHHQQWCHDPRFTQPPFQPTNIGRHPRHHCGIQDRHERAFIFPHHRQDIGRNRDRHVRQSRPQDLGNAYLMRRVGIGMQQTHRHRLDLHRLQCRNCSHDARLVQRFQHDTAHTDPLVHLDHTRRRHWSLRLDPVVKVGLARNVLPPDRHHMSEAPRRHQCRARAFALQDHVRGHCRAVQHLAQIGRDPPRRIQRQRDRRQKRD